MNSREFSGLNSMFNENNLSPRNNFSKEQRTKFLESVGTQLDEIENNLAIKAKEKGLEFSPIYIKRKNSLDEVRYISHGIIKPHENLNFLKSKEAMVSYSRKNEEWARRLHLSLRSTGIITWFDNQETNVSSEKNDISDESEDFSIPEGEIKKGLGMGNEWRTSMLNGISDNSSTVVLLTHDVLDKFDVVGGQEIIKTLKNRKKSGNENNLIVAYVDDKDRGSVLDRLDSFVDNNKGREDYMLAIDAIKKSPKLELSKSDLEGNIISLGDKVIDTIPKGKEVNRRISQDSTKNSPNLSNSILDNLENLKDYTPAEDSIEEKLYKRAIDECKIIVESNTNPNLLVQEDRLNLTGFTVADFNSENKSKYEGVSNALKSFGLEEGNDPLNSSYYSLFPIDIEDINLKPAEFYEKVSAYSDRGIRFWTLVPPDFWPKIYEVTASEEKKLEQMDVEKDRDAYFELEGKINFLKDIQKRQGLEIKDLDLKDPQGLASYLMMKQALIDYEKRFNDNRPPSPFLGIRGQP